MSDLTRRQKRRLTAHFGFTKTPFHKSMKARDMFDSRGQRELYQALDMWVDLRGLALVTGASGVGKSITLRRFVADLDEARYRVVRFTYLPTTVTGFLRSFSRSLGLQMRLHGSDLFDAARQHLVTYEDEHGSHPVIVIDDAEGISVPVLDAIGRLTAYELDAEDRFSVLLSGTEDILTTLRHPGLESLRSRIGYAQILRALSLEDTRNYIRFHLTRADVDGGLFTDQAARHVFHATQGRPRAINQLCLQAAVPPSARSGGRRGARVRRWPIHGVPDRRPPAVSGRLRRWEMKHPVPRNWAPDKALAVIEGLQGYVDAIGDEYGDELIELLAEQWGAPPDVDDKQLDLPF